MAGLAVAERALRHRCAGSRARGVEGGFRYERWADPLRFGIRTDVGTPAGRVVRGYNGAGAWSLHPTNELAAAEPPPKLVLDLERLAHVPQEKAGPLQRYAATIQSQRGDYNGKVLSIRQDDLRTLAVIYDQSPSVLTEQLISWGVLDADARRAVHEEV